MQLNLDTSIIENYANPSQIIRVMTEHWVKNQGFCPICGSDIIEYPNNNPVGDFYCNNCMEDYELKSKKGSMGKKIVDGAYNTMIERLESARNPHFFFLSYDANQYEVINFVVIPKYFFTSEIIEKRTALSNNARRAGWIGCNILIEHIPNSGKVFYVKNGKTEDKSKILHNWEKTTFLQQVKTRETKSWILDIMKCIDKLKKTIFTLDEMYCFEHALSQKYTSNNHIKDKIRQQLQILRDKGYIEFVSRGVYRLIG